MSYQFNAAAFRAVIESSELSRREIARRAGVHWNTIGKWELPAASPRAEELIAVCEVLGVDIHDLFMKVEKLPLSNA